MDQILDKLLARPSLQTAQMAGAALRAQLTNDPRRTFSGLQAWSEHSHPMVRIASGIGYGMLGQRDRGALADVLRYVERLANDDDADVREHGASAALEQLWIIHTDAVTSTVEQWVAGKNDNVREVIIRTISRIATSGQIVRPTILRRFIESGLAIYDRLVPVASPQVRAATAESIDELGCLAPDLVVPFVRNWSKSEDIGTLRCVMELAKLPFASSCEGLGIEEVSARVRSVEAKIRTRAARWVREGVGTVEYQPFVAKTVLARSANPALPFTHVAEAYRGCQLRCEFCHARSLSEWVGDDPKTFVRRVSVVRNAAEVLARELAEPAMQPRGERVICIGSDSDPYQPAEERFEVTRDMLKVCLELEHPVIVQTRQELVLRDLDVMEALAERGLVNVMISMQTATEGIRNKVELGTSSVAERFRTMRMLATKNVPVGLLLSPIMPDLTDDPAVLEETVRRASDAGAKWVVAQVLDLRGSAAVKVPLFLEGYTPELVERYETLYSHGEKGRTADPAYVKNLTEDVVPSLATKHGLDDYSRMLTSGHDPLACLVRQ